MSYKYEIKVTGINHNTAWYYCSNQLTGNAKLSNGTIIVGTIVQQIYQGNSGDAGSINNIKSGIIEFDKLISEIELSIGSGYNYMTKYDYYINDKYQNSVSNTVNSKRYVDTKPLRVYLFLIKNNNNICNYDGENLIVKSQGDFNISLFNDSISYLSIIDKHLLELLSNNKYNIAMLR